MRRRLATLWSCTLLLTVACGKLEVQSVRVATGVPDALLGEWHGNWSSSVADATDGELTVRLQRFRGDPVLTVELDNPCVVPGEYQLRVVAGGFALVAADGATFQAALGAARTLVGDYACTADHGTWAATWQRDLPTIVDLGGTWSATLDAAGQVAVPFHLDLQQSVAAGQIQLDGTMVVEGLAAGALPVHGQARFRDGGFEVVLETAEASGVDLQLLGSGTPSGRVVTAGLLEVQPGSGWPFATAAWRGSWTGP